jgi:hypothetical protein
MAKKAKIPETKTSRLAVGRSNHYKLEPAVARTHYGEHRLMSGGQPYAFLAKKADDAWFVVSEWSGKKHGIVQQWSDGEWTFSNIESQEQTPNWLRAQYRDTPTTIYNLSSRLYSGSTPEEAIGRALGVSTASQPVHATRKASTTPMVPGRSLSVRKIGTRWQPVDKNGRVVRGDIYNADGTGYSTRQGAAEAAAMLRQLGGRG